MWRWELRLATGEERRGRPGIIPLPAGCTTLGRDQDTCTVYIDDCERQSVISRTHAKIVVQNAESPPTLYNTSMNGCSILADGASTTLGPRANHPIEAGARVTFGPNADKSLQYTLHRNEPELQAGRGTKRKADEVNATPAAPAGGSHPASQSASASQDLPPTQPAAGASAGGAGTVGAVGAGGVAPLATPDLGGRALSADFSAAVGASTGHTNGHNNNEESDAERAAAAVDYLAWECGAAVAVPAPSDDPTAIEAATAAQRQGVEKLKASSD